MNILDSIYVSDLDVKEKFELPADPNFEVWLQDGTGDIHVFVFDSLQLELLSEIIRNRLDSAAIQYNFRRKRG